MILSSTTLKYCIWIDSCRSDEHQMSSSMVQYVIVYLINDMKQNNKLNIEFILSFNWFFLNENIITINKLIGKANI